MKGKLVENGKIVRELEIRDISHLQACIKYPSRIDRSKKQYNRKGKYKQEYDYE